jgi:hypothetical protein
MIGGSCGARNSQLQGGRAPGSPEITPGERIAHWDRNGTYQQWEVILPLTGLSGCDAADGGVDDGQANE